ncbi:DUF305 domain-containing protein [Streptomyces coeruleorubidus]|uniref:DUF305 domain-containing protein n=1 Tax=Streptomyces coeruleorubidus TaxID=116188 RepID=UPI00237F5CF1|nr:DUF305 domain-containing protein [Streptomyces coeruleorubidus]WDV49848.1 DUF305 domain-containing protein [Streptomyces coeruleorubidus]
MLFRRASRTSVVMTGLVALAALTAGGCDSSPDRKPAAADGPAVIAPGEPGEANRTLSAEEAAGRHSENDSPNSADVSYARMMIEHHAQALVMTELAPERAESAKVKRVAARIAAAQKPEIDAMKSWLKSYGKPLKAERHEHAAMPGMATETQLNELRAAHGKAFDQLFLTLMTTHHQGAITMAADVKGQGNNIRIEEMADEVIAQQTSEITRMRDML